jgi:hypothetical protein
MDSRFFPDSFQFVSRFILFLCLKEINYKMKRIIGIFVFVLFAGNTFAQSISQSNIPAVVLNAFQLDYPNAEDVKWKLEKGNYRVDYRVNSKAHKLTLENNGNVLKHSQDLFISEVPKVVQEAIGTKVPYFDMHDADKYEEGDKITYEIKFKMEGKNHYFWINEKGELLKYRKELKDSEIPLPILSLINNQYGPLDIDESKYVEENGEKIYIIKGEINDSDHAFWIDHKAFVIKHTQDLRNTEIPAPVMNAAKAAYEGYEIRDADLTEDGGKTIYILRLRKSKDNVYVTISHRGKILEVK